MGVTDFLVVPVGMGHLFLQLVTCTGNECLLSESLLIDLLCCEAIWGKCDWFWALIIHFCLLMGLL